MKKYFANMSLFYMLLSLLILSSCKDDEVVEGQASGLGYFQVELAKQIQTYGITSGSELVNLADAKKVKVDLLYNNRQVSQTLNLYAVNEEAAEYGLTSESIKLAAGDYQLTGYTIYGEYVEGVTPGDKAPILQEGEPDESTTFTIVESQIEVLTIDVVAQLRGKLSLILDKDFSNILDPKSAELPTFDYNKVEKVELTIREGVAGAVRDFTMEAHRKGNGYLLHTDTIELRVNNYQMQQLRLLDKRDQVLMVLDDPHSIQIANQELNQDTVTIDMPLTKQLNDYIALYNIWKALDGENWYATGYGITTGANWLFTYSDGRPRPLDMWGKQQGVGLNAEGRVTSLNLGVFNPKGFVPDAIGQLTELQSLYIGHNSDVTWIDGEEGMPTVVDRYMLEQQGVDVIRDRMEIAKERFALRSPATKSSFETYNANNSKFKYASKQDMDLTDRTNRITGISAEIGKLQNLTYLSVANGFVSEFPASLGGLKNLTDLEIYRCPITELPAFVKELPELIALNFSGNKNLDEARTNETLSELFNGPSKEKIQMLYLSDNNLKSLPASLANLKNLGLLDLGINKLTHLPMLGDDVAIVQCLLDYNQLVEIPRDWFRVDDLEKLSVVSNKLTKFPDMFDAESIYKVKEVNFSSNLISGFADGFKGIHAEIVNLTENKFTEFPSAFSDTESKMNFLQLQTNMIDTVSPEAIKNLPLLNALDLKGNRLRYMPAEFNIETFPYMTALDLSINEFAMFPYQVLYVSSLTELRAAEQFRDGRKCLKRWPDNIDQHMSLRVLDLSGNDIGRAGNFPQLLNSLNIFDNPNIYITVPQNIQFRIMEGSFQFIYSEDQNVIFEQ